MAKRYRRIRRYARRAYGRVRRSASKMTIPITVVGGVLGMPATGAMINAATHGDWNGMAKIAGNYAGIDNNGQFSFAMLQSNLMPLIAGVAVHKIAGKLGINAMLAKAKIPLLRV